MILFQGKYYIFASMTLGVWVSEDMEISVPGEIRGTTQARYIEEADHVTRWILEGSFDGEEYFVIKDKSQVL